ncbi:MAG: hypothetical protein BWY54_01028 [Candidatus Dependentiae bacterium ADurb.Bin331]|nr:MAG: hypothetical protein BWY54_01028 [Candidatus Dependentiae bacterium ADurb.Bin331]
MSNIVISVAGNFAAFRNFCKIKSIAAKRISTTKYEIDCSDFDKFAEGMNDFIVSFASNDNIGKAKDSIAFLLPNENNVSVALKNIDAEDASAFKNAKDIIDPTDAPFDKYFSYDAEIGFYVAKDFFDHAEKNGKTLTYDEYVASFKQDDDNEIDLDNVTDGKQIKIHVYKNITAFEKYCQDKHIKFERLTGTDADMIYAIDASALLDAMQGKNNGYEIAFFSKDSVESNEVVNAVDALDAVAKIKKMKFNDSKSFLMKVNAALTDSNHDGFISDVKSIASACGVVVAKASTISEDNAGATTWSGYAELKSSYKEDLQTFVAKFQTACYKISYEII